MGDLIPLYNLKNVKITHGGVLLFVKLQAKACNFTKVTLLQMVPNRATHHYVYALYVKRYVLLHFVFTNSVSENLRHLGAFASIMILCVF